MVNNNVCSKCSVSMMTIKVSVSGCWNRGVQLYIEVSSFQSVGIEGLHCI